MNSDILDELIKEGESLSSTISYVPPPPNVLRTFSVYRTSDQARYQNWLSSTIRFVKTFHHSDLEEVQAVSKKLSSENHLKVLAILRAIKLLPNEPEYIGNKTGGNNNNTIHITTNQNNTQQVSFSLFMDAIKDEITGKDLKALKEIMKDYEAEPEKTKSKLLEKVKSFGGDVLSNIVANILTNPGIYGGLF